MERKVVVTGVGLLSSLGDSLSEWHANLCEGQSGLGPIERFSTEGLVCQQAGEIRSFSPRAYLGKKNIRPLDRTGQLVTVAAQLALEDSGWSAEMRSQHEVGLVLGTMFCSANTIAEFDRRGRLLGPRRVNPMDFPNTVINAAAGQAAIWHDLRGVNATIAGEITAGLQAIAYATDLIRSGQATSLLAGGAEELCFESLYGFERAGLLCRPKNGEAGSPIPFDMKRNGFALGEGAALLMLENAELADARGAKVLAEIRGHGSGYDLSCGKDAQKSVEAIAKAIRLALNDAQIDAHELDCLSASANGSVLFDRYEAQAVTTALGEKTPHLPVTAIKSMLGETLGASGAMQAAALLASMGNGVLPGIRGLEQTEENSTLKRASRDSQRVDVHCALINSVGLDGNACSLVLADSSGRGGHLKSGGGPSVRRWNVGSTI